MRARETACLTNPALRTLSAVYEQDRMERVWVVDSMMMTCNDSGVQFACDHSMACGMSCRRGATPPHSDDKDLALSASYPRSHHPRTVMRSRQLVGLAILGPDLHYHYQRVSAAVSGVGHPTRRGSLAI